MGILELNTRSRDALILDRRASITNLTHYLNYLSLLRPILIFDIDVMTIEWANQAGLELYQVDCVEELPCEQPSVDIETAQLKLKSYLKQFEQGETVASLWPHCLGEKTIPARECWLSGLKTEAEKMVVLVEIGPLISQHELDRHRAFEPSSNRQLQNQDQARLAPQSRLNDHPRLNVGHQKQTEDSLARLLIQSQHQHTQLIQKNRKLQEETKARAHAQQFLQLVMDNIPQAIFWKDCDSRFLGCNRVFLNNTGLKTVDEIVGKTDYDMPWEKEESDWYRACDRRVMESNTPEYHIVETQLRADGQKIWLDTNKVPLHNADGDVIGLLATFEDITVRIQAEAALENQILREQLLRKIIQEVRKSLNSQQIFQTTVNSIGEAFKASRCHLHSYRNDENAHLPLVAEYFIPECESMAALDLHITPHAQQVLSQDFAYSSPNVYLDPFIQDSIPATKPLEMKSMLAVRTSYHGQANGAIVLHHCDKKLTRQEFLALSKADQDKLLRQWTPEEIELLEAVAEQVGIALAQAELLEREKRQKLDLANKNSALLKALEETEKANRSKTIFFSSMSHELRTPLNGILGYTQLMKQSSDLSLNDKKQISGIHKCGEHLLDLINDLIDLSSAEIEMLEIESATVDFYRFLNRLVDVCQIEAQQKNISFITKFHPSLPSIIYTDERRLRQVLFNLMNDAIKRIGCGSVAFLINPVRVEQDKLVASQHPDSACKIQFKVKLIDNVGKRKEAKNISISSKAEGQTMLQQAAVGPGLAISQKIAMRMGSEIQIQNISQFETIYVFELECSMDSINELDCPLNEENPRNQLDEGGLDDIKSEAMTLPPLETLVQLNQLAQKGLIYELRSQIQSIEQSDPQFRLFCQQISDQIAAFKMRTIKETLQKHIHAISAMGA